MRSPSQKQTDPKIGEQRQLNFAMQGTCVLDVERKHHWMSAFETAVKSGKSAAGFAVPDDCMLHFHGEQLVGAFSARLDQNIQYAYVTQEGVAWRDTEVLMPDNSSKTASHHVKQLKSKDERHLELEAEEDSEIHANRCVIQ